MEGRKDLALVLDPKSVSHSFKYRVTREMTKARERAYESIGRPVPARQKDHRHTYKRYQRKPAPLKTTKFRVQGTCKGCGRPWDEWTPGCHNCNSRHQMRKTMARRNGDAPAREPEPVELPPLPDFYPGTTIHRRAWHTWA